MNTIMNGSLLRVDSAATTLPGSPTNSFIADEVASTCPLLTPSPPTNALVDPLPDDNSEPKFVIGEELANKLQHVNDDQEVADSASSTSSAEPACTQLLHTHNHYHHLNKDTETCQQENGAKLQNLQLTFRKNPSNFCFMSWNWPMIRKISVWSFLSSLIACVGLVVMMIVTLPKTCNPPTQWYQGSLMYEVFTASFQDSNNDGIGDLKGLASRVNYLQGLGVQTVRLNSIFPAVHYPEDYKNVTALNEIAPVLGNLKDFSAVVNALHNRNMTLVLDLPIWPLVKQFHYPVNEKLLMPEKEEHNSSDLNPSSEFLRKSAFASVNDPVTDAIRYWVTHGVDGFYIKGLEHLTDDPNFVVALRRWKKILGADRVLLVHHDVIDSTPDSILSIVLNNIDLVDIQLVIEGGVNALRHQIESIKNGTLFAKAGTPWIHWSLGDVDTPRVATRLALSNATLGATLVQLMLPGTPSIFYGDEVGLQQLFDPEDERADIRHLHQLAAMVWPSNERQFSSRGVLAWMHGHPAHSSFSQRETIRNMAELRNESPAIYINSLSKDGCNKANAEVKYAERGLFVLQRFYPRRPFYVVVSNLNVGRITADLSKILFSGEITVGPTIESKTESISFKSISLWPGESVVIKLD